MISSDLFSGGVRDAEQEKQKNHSLHDESVNPLNVDVLELNRVSAIATVENRCHESLWEEAGQQQVGFSVSATLPPVKSGLILPSVVAA